MSQEDGGFGCISQPTVPKLSLYEIYNLPELKYAKLQTKTVPWWHSSLDRLHANIAWKGTLPGAFQVSVERKKLQGGSKDPTSVDSIWKFFGKSKKGYILRAFAVVTFLLQNNKRHSEASSSPFPMMLKFAQDHLGFTLKDRWIFLWIWETSDL